MKRVGKGGSVLVLGEALECLRGELDCSFDAVVTDPPYGLSFMGKKWDYDVPSVDIWGECLRVLKPGGHLLAFGGSRTYHRMTVNIEDAGFEIRDQIMWLYGSGFPKSHDVSKGIDKAAGAERKVVGSRKEHGIRGGNLNRRACNGESRTHVINITEAATDAAKQWEGWGTALKPAHEPICMARKPFKGTVAANVEEWGTGALNVDGCRVPGENSSIQRREAAARSGKAGMDLHSALRVRNGETKFNKDLARYVTPRPGELLGRWPANVIHDGSEEVLAGAGSAARFFYCAKASKTDRDEGNTHPTVKPTALMRHLCRMVTPAGGTVLDPFMGSGSTGKAAILEGFNFFGIEWESNSFDIAEARVGNALASVCLGEWK